jgi:hypothetical protein
MKRVFNLLFFSPEVFLILHLIGTIREEFIICRIFSPLTGSDHLNVVIFYEIGNGLF